MSLWVGMNPLLGRRGKKFGRQLLVLNSGHLKREEWENDWKYWNKMDQEVKQFFMYDFGVA